MDRAGARSLGNGGGVAAQDVNRGREAGSPVTPRDLAGRSVPWITGGAAVAIAYVVKRHYSTASADDLEWILRPTVALVSGVTGVSFDREAGVGYTNAPLRYSIVPACAGVNFWVAAFLSMAFAFLRTERRAGRAAFGLFAVALGAYGATVLANSLRIVLALEIHTRELHVGGFGADVVHRTLGVLVYVPALFLVFDLAERARGRLHA